jgi:hypothetical protein
MRFKNKPKIIEAFQWTKEDVPQWWIDAKGIQIEVESCTALIPTLEGVIRASPGDWIIKGVKNELYPCKPDIFDLTYEPA